jgi:hypothetical protein
MPSLSALDAVTKIRGREQGGCRDDNRAELHRSQDHLPQLDLVAEHEHDPVASRHPLRPKPMGHLAGPGGHLRERPPPL